MRPVPMPPVLGIMSTRPSVMGPVVSSLPECRHAAELTLLSVVGADVFGLMAAALLGHDGGACSVMTRASAVCSARGGPACRWLPPSLPWAWSRRCRRLRASESDRPILDAPVKVSVLGLGVGRHPVRDALLGVA
jgi:hypothetical protein